MKCLKTAGYMYVANSVDPYQVLHFVASDVGLHCLCRLSVPILKVIKVRIDFF